jgi:hypothetical protein
LIAIAAGSAANVSAVSGLIWAIVTIILGTSNTGWWALIVSPMLFWFIAALFAFLLLIVLWPIHEMTSSKISLPLFLTIGIAVSTYFGYVLHSSGAHGQPSSLEADFMKAIIAIVYMGITGVCAAFASWKTLQDKFWRVHNKPL